MDFDLRQATPARSWRVAGLLGSGVSPQGIGRKGASINNPDLVSIKGAGPLMPAPMLIGRRHADLKAVARDR